MPSFFDPGTGFREDHPLHSIDFSDSAGGVRTGRFNLSNELTGVIRSAVDRDSIELDLQDGVNIFTLEPSTAHPRFNRNNIGSLSDGILELERRSADGRSQVIATGVRDSSGNVTLRYVPSSREIRDQSSSESFIYSLTIRGGSRNVTTQRGYLIRRASTVVNPSYPHGSGYFSGSIDERGSGHLDEYRDDLTGTLAAIDRRSNAPGSDFGAQPNRIYGQFVDGRSNLPYRQTGVLAGDGIIDHYSDSDVFLTHRLLPGRTYAIYTEPVIPNQRLRALNRDNPGRGTQSSLRFTSGRGPSFSIWNPPRPSTSTPPSLARNQTYMFDALTHTDPQPRSQNSPEWWNPSSYNYSTRTFGGAQYNVRLFRPSEARVYAIQVYPNSSAIASRAISSELRENLYGIGGYSVILSDVTSDPTAATHIQQVGYMA